MQMLDDSLFDFLHMEIVNLLADYDEKNYLNSLENIGFQTGHKFVEKTTKDYIVFKDELETMKYICKNFWEQIFKKQIDNLKTNHQGIYVLTDNRFKFLTQLTESKQYNNFIPRYLAFTCGLLRGSLLNLGINAIVIATVVSPPIVRFQVEIKKG